MKYLLDTFMVKLQRFNCKGCNSTKGATARIIAEYFFEYECETNNLGGYKYHKDACRHARECNGCGFYYCADDELIQCNSCFDVGFCYGCIGEITNFSWTYSCKECWKYNREKHKQYCPKCNRNRRIYNPYKKQCFSCWRAVFL